MHGCRFNILFYFLFRFSLSFLFGNILKSRQFSGSWMNFWVPGENHFINGKWVFPYPRLHEWQLNKRHHYTRLVIPSESGKLPWTILFNNLASPRPHVFFSLFPVLWGSGKNCLFNMSCECFKLIDSRQQKRHKNVAWSIKYERSSLITGNDDNRINGIYFKVDVRNFVQKKINLIVWIYWII